MKPDPETGRPPTTPGENATAAKLGEWVALSEQCLHPLVREEVI